MNISLTDLPQQISQFLHQLKDQEIIGLIGPIGAGKTTFVSHLLAAIDKKALQKFSSPTFTILNRYETASKIINHVDLYRLNSYREFEALDLIPLFQQPNTVTFIEWADKFPELTSILTQRILLNHVSEQPEVRSLSIESIKAQTN